MHILGNKIGVGTVSGIKGERLYGGKHGGRRWGRTRTEQERSKGKVKQGEESKAGGVEHDPRTFQSLPSLTAYNKPLFELKP